MDSPDGSLSTLDSNATSQNGQESLSSQQKRCHRSEEPFHHSRAQELRSSHIAVKFEEPSTSISFPRDLEKIQPPLEYIDAGPPDPVLDLVPHGNFPATQSFPHSPYCFGLNTDSCVFLQSPETTSYFRGSDNGRSITESPSLNEKAMHDEKCKNTRSLSVTFGPVDRRNMDKVRFSEDGVESEDDYSASVSAIILRRASSKRRSRSSFSPEEFSNTSRRRSSVFTTSSGDTGVSMEELEGGTTAAGTDEQVVENIRLHKEVLTNVKHQPWSMRRKLKLVQQAKSYIKRHEGELQERLAQSRSTKDFLARFNILLVKEWQHTKRELANMMNLLIPWELRIKEIESHFGSAVASYFTFLRWLFWVNFILALALILFVAIPELLSTPGGSDCAERKEVLPEEKADSRKLSTLFEFEGILKYSPIFYGYYTNEENSRYNIPLAFFIVTLLLYIYSFVAILKRMAANSKMSKLSDKDDECVFTWKLFTGWDYMIGNAETAQNRTSSIILSFKEALVEEAEKQRDVFSWKVICIRIIVNILVVFLLAVSAYSIIMVVERSQETVARKTLWRKNEAVVVIWFIGVTFPRLLEKLGNFERLHPRKHLRMLLARIMVLQIVNLYTFFLEHLVETSKTIDELKLLKPKLYNHSNPTTPPPTYTPFPNVTQCTYKIINCSLLSYFLASSSTTVTYLPIETTGFSGIKDISSTRNYQSTIFDNTSLFINETFSTFPMESITNTQETLFTTDQTNVPQSYSGTDNEVTYETNESQSTVAYIERISGEYNETTNLTDSESVNNESMTTNGLDEFTTRNFVDFDNKADGSFEFDESTAIDVIDELTTENFVEFDNKTDGRFEFEESAGIDELTTENFDDFDNKTRIIEFEESTASTFENTTQAESNEDVTFNIGINFADDENLTLQHQFSMTESIQMIETTTSHQTSDSGEEIYGSDEDVSSTENMITSRSDVKALNEDSSPVVNSGTPVDEPLKNYDYALEFSNETQQVNARDEFTSIVNIKQKRSVSSLVNQIKQPQDDLDVFSEVAYGGNESIWNGNSFKPFVHNPYSIERGEKILPKEMMKIEESINEDNPLESVIRKEFPNLDEDLVNDHLPTTFSDYFLDNFTETSNDVIEGDNPSENLSPPPIVYDLNKTVDFNENVTEGNSSSPSIEEKLTPKLNSTEESNMVSSVTTNITSETEPTPPEVYNVSKPQIDPKKSYSIFSTHNKDSITNGDSKNVSPSILDNNNTFDLYSKMNSTSTLADNDVEDPSHRGKSIFVPLPSTKTMPTGSNKDTKEAIVEKMCVIYECVQKNIEDDMHGVTTTLQTSITKKPRTFCTKQLPLVTRKKLRNLCWETKIGQELVKLTVVDLVSTIGLTILSDAGRALFVRYMNPCWCWDLEKTFPKYADFNIAENILGLVYNQGFVWIGMFFAPGLPLINLIKLVVLMYLNSWAVLTSNVPHEVVFRASRSNNFYLALLLLQLFLAVLPVGYTIVATEPSWHCGPFSGDNYMYDIFTRVIKRNLPASSHKVLDYIASPGTIIPLLILLILIIYYLGSLTYALKEANIDLKIQLRRERTEERRKMYQLVAKKKRSGVELLDSTLSKWREIIPDTPVEKIGEEISGKTKEDFMMKFIHKTRRMTSDTTCDKSDEDRDHTNSIEQNQNGGHRNSGTKPGDKKVYHKRKSSSSIWSSDNIPEIKISESNNSDVAESDETETEQGSRRAGSADTVIEINEKRERKVDSPGVFKSPRRLHNSGENAEKKEKNGERRRKDIEGSNGEKRHKKRKKMESAQSVEVTDDRHGSGILEDLRRYTHSPGGGLGRKHRLKKLSKENLDKLQVQIEMEEEDKHNLIRRKPTESSSDIEEIDEKAGNNRNKRKPRKDDLLMAKEGNLLKADSLDVEYRNLSREFISPKRKQLLKQLKYKNRRYQIYCDDVGMSRSLEHDCDSLGAPRQDENKSKSLNFLLEQR